MSEATKPPTSTARKPYAAIQRLIGVCKPLIPGLDAATGAHVWKYETHGAIWACLLLAGDRLYVGNEDGTMTVLRAGRQ